MSAPKLQDLPKVSDDFKSQLEGQIENLKDVITEEKIVLPTAEGELRGELDLTPYLFIIIFFNFMQFA